MEEIISVHSEQAENVSVDIKDVISKESDNSSPSALSPNNSNLIKSVSSDSSDDEVPVRRQKKKAQKVTDSSDSENAENPINRLSIKNNSVQNEMEHEENKESGDDVSHPDSDIDNPTIKTKRKSRIQLNSGNSDSEESLKASKNEGQQTRMKQKRSKLKDKFKTLLSVREKQTSPEDRKMKSDNDKSEDSSQSESEISSIKTIKQKIKQSMSMIPSICDPDTSDDESNLSTKLIPKQKQKKERKCTKLTSPKPIRMSAKQAMENMQKIKSESNRMLREKEVSLPYHRPKALSLKDILNRRKPAVSADGKALPIKMNEDQLKQYASMLEQRQKEMMELCKSESEDDNEDEKELESLPTEVPTEILNDDAVDDIKNNTDLQEKLTDSVSTEDTDKLLDYPVKDTSTNSIDDQAVLISQENTIIKDIENTVESECEDSEMKLVYNNSVEEEKSLNGADKNTGCFESESEINTISDLQVPQESTIDNTVNQSKNYSEPESQLISLQYDSERIEADTEETNDIELVQTENTQNNLQDSLEKNDSTEINDDFMSDDEFNVEDIDKIIENAEIIQGNTSTSLTKPETFKMQPKLTGGPGMVIDLNNSANTTKKLTGVELLKERFTFFAKLKTPEEQERENEKMIKPGALHLKLKKQLEEQIAEQRSLEWSRRLEEMKQTEATTVEGDTSDVEDDIEKMEAKLEAENENAEQDVSSEGEEEPIENDIELKDEPRKSNPMLDDEAEESDCDEADVQNVEEVAESGDDGNEPDGDDDEESEESSDEESEDETKPKRGRILKAFEDSDDEDQVTKENGELNAVKDTADAKQDHVSDTHEVGNTQLSEINNVDVFASPAASQDEVIQLAQKHKSASDDLFSSQDNVSTKTISETKTAEVELATQTFSILDSTPCDEATKPAGVEDNMLYGTQPYHDPKLAALASGLTQGVLNSQLTETQSSQPQLGDDILAMCTGKFYDNEFVSQTDDERPCESVTQQTFDKDDFEDDCEVLTDRVVNNDEHNNLNSEEIDSLNTKNDKAIENVIDTDNSKATGINNKAEDGELKSILDELNDPEFDVPKSRKFFTGSNKNINGDVLESAQIKKKFIIDSDEEDNKEEQPKKKKIKKKKLEQRALQISDDEDEEQEIDENDEESYLSDVDDNNERVVDYDSEENEIEIQPQIVKKKRKATDYFEQEAELTSEDEWVGSGDEDEAGLDRMEREEGDDDVFHQGQLRKQLGQIHMREVLDQDKREVRLLQELLFEDGDLGDGHRQRKFRWKNTDGGDETGTVVDEFGDTQEDEFESEEQWRKQRHEREVFLRQMQKENEDKDANISLNRTTIIKANLSAKTMSTLLMENQPTSDAESPVVEKKTAKDIPSPKKSFAIFQQSYHGSLLTRGGGSLARLAALATPLATDDDAPKIGSLAPSSKRNFVFSTLTPESQKPKVTIKRKADTSIGTPKLVKKMKTEENKKNSKSSLLDQLTVL